jgi:hypothetical protein
MTVTESKTINMPVDNMAVEEPKTAENNKESTESPPAESTTPQKADTTTTTTTFPKDDWTVETPSETPAMESEDKLKKCASLTKQPEDHADVKKIVVEAQGDSKDSTKAAVEPAVKDEAPVTDSESKVVAETTEEPTNKTDGLNNVSELQITQIRADQNEKCPICKRDFLALETLGVRLVIDQDHVTGQVRGILCENCKKFLVHFDHNIETLERAASFLTEYERGPCGCWFTKTL